MISVAYVRLVGSGVILGVVCIAGEIIIIASRVRFFCYPACGRLGDRVRNSVECAIAPRGCAGVAVWRPVVSGIVLFGAAIVCPCGLSGIV